VTVGQPQDAADATAISQVVARLAFLADHGTIDEYLALMDPQVEWHMPANPTLGLRAEDRSGHDDVRAGVEARRAAGVQGPGSATKHLITNTTVLLGAGAGRSVGDDAGDVGRGHGDGGDADPNIPAEATADSYWHFYRTTTTTPEVVAMGRYHDHFRQTEDGRWLLRARHIIRD